MNGFEIIIPILGILLVLIPVAGLTLVLTARFALRPIMEALSAGYQRPGGASLADLVNRIRELTEQVEGMRAELGQLREAHAFDRRLLDAQAAEGKAPERPREVKGSGPAERR